MEVSVHSLLASGRVLVKERMAEEKLLIAWQTGNRVIQGGGSEIDALRPPAIRLLRGGFTNTDRRCSLYSAALGSPPSIVPCNLIRLNSGRSILVASP